MTVMEEALDMVSKARWQLQVGLQRFSLTERERRMRAADAELAALDRLLRKSAAASTI